jgi:hypothetical protein
MMTNDEILELAKTCGFDFSIKWRVHWRCWEEQLLKFALTIHEDGYNKGYDDGWEGSKVSTEMGTMEFDDE